MRNFFIMLVSFNVLIGQPAQCDGTDFRNLIILLDQGFENVANDYAMALSMELISALHTKSAPILVSCSLWKNFVERRQEFASCAAVNNSDERKYLDHYVRVNERINYWFNFFGRYSTDIVENKALVAEQVNQEFCSEHACDDLWQQNKLVKDSRHISQLLPFYLIDFNPLEWNVYNINDLFYLFIPQNSAQIKRDCGLHVDHLIRVTNPEDISLLHFKNMVRGQSSFVDALRATFVDDQDDTSHSWNIYLSGHGGNSQWAGSEVCSLSTIADLTLSEFRSALSFFNDEIKTHTLFYSTCFGGGIHAHEPYQVEGVSSKYNYMIVINCLTDNPCMGYGCWTKELSYGDFLSPDDLVFDETDGTWSIKVHHGSDCESFFYELEQGGHAPYALDYLLDAATYVGPPRIANLPVVRLPQSDAFITLFPSNTTKISALLVAFKQSLSKDIELNDQTRFVLVDTPLVAAPIKVCSDIVPQFISILPGEAVHHLCSLHAEGVAHTELFKAFTALHGLCFDKIFLIDELVCQFDYDALPDDIIDQKETVTCKNVVIKLEGDHLVRFFFQTEDEKVFSMHMSRVSGGEPRAAVELQGAAADAHITYFNSIKEKAHTHNSSASALALYDALRNELCGLQVEINCAMAAHT